MFIKQISVFLENKTGALCELTHLLGEGGIDLMALSVADTQNFGIIRIIVADNQVDPALNILRGNGYNHKSKKCHKPYNKHGECRNEFFIVVPYRFFFLFFF